MTPYLADSLPLRLYWMIEISFCCCHKFLRLWCSNMSGFKALFSWLEPSSGRNQLHYMAAHDLNFDISQCVGSVVGTSPDQLSVSDWMQWCLCLIANLIDPQLSPRYNYQQTHTLTILPMPLLWILVQPNHNVCFKSHIIGQCHYAVTGSMYRSQVNDDRQVPRTVSEFCGVSFNHSTNTNITYNLLQTLFCTFAT